MLDIQGHENRIGGQSVITTSVEFTFQRRRVRYSIKYMAAKIRNAMQPRYKGVAVRYWSRKTAGVEKNAIAPNN